MKLRKTPTRPMDSEMRAPYSVREKRSRAEPVGAEDVATAVFRWMPNRWTVRLEKAPATYRVRPVTKNWTGITCALIFDIA